MNYTYTPDNAISLAHPSTFRIAEPQDVLQIHRLLNEGFKEFTNQFNPSALKVTPSSIRDSLSAWRVLIQDGKLVGCVMAFQEELFFSFCYMTVAPDCRGLGLGQILVSELLVEASQRHLSLIKIVLREALTENVRFFTRHGFVKTISFHANTHYVYELRIEM